MSSYKVFKHPEKGFEAVKSGFAWLAPFNPIWPLFRGLWIVFVTYIFFILVLASIDAQIYGLVDFIDITNANNLQWILLIIQIVIFASPGFKGNEWTATNLQKKGYIFDCSIEANNKKEALTFITSSKT
jgi:hypothetical protein